MQERKWRLTQRKGLGAKAQTRVTMQLVVAVMPVAGNLYVSLGYPGENFT
jgi:hypothetical protein